MASNLLATKFHIPPWRPNSLDRPRLIQKLDGAGSQHHKLVLISAPAGYGKTTLVSEWIHATGNPKQFCWLSLDEKDNELKRFLSYWIGSLIHKNETIQAKLEPFLNLPQLPPITALVDEIINELVDAQASLTMVFDDYHVISNLEIHEAVAYFLENCPSGVQLVLTTRADPPFPLARMRARQEVTEIRARDLRFTPDESRGLIQSLVDLSLSDDNLRALDKRTEGWAAGLQLAAIALRSHSDPQVFIDTFHGSHRFILDYLAEEVIRQQPAEIQQFLSRTSILESFNAAACQAVSGQANSAALLDRLEQCNLFIIPLDDFRDWYRYHHLFADYLRSGLTLAEASELYKKAAQWHEENNLIFEGVDYALKSGDADYAADQIGRALQTNTTWSGGSVSTLSSWLNNLPLEILKHRPQLSLNASRIFYLCGRFDLAEKCIEQVETSLQDEPDTSDIRHLIAIAQLYRGSIASVRGQVEKAIELTMEAKTVIGPGEHLLHARGHFSLGLAYELGHQLERSVENYLASSERASSAGVLFLAVHALCSAAQVQINQGLLSDAEKTSQTAIQMTGENRIPPIGLAWIILGNIALERNELDTARHFLQDGISLARKGGLLDDLILGLTHLAHLHAAEGESQAAITAIEEVKHNMQIFRVPRMNRLSEAYAARLHLLTGDLEKAQKWAKEYEPIRGDQMQEFEELTLARVYLKKNDLDQIEPILQPILERSKETGKKQTQIEVLMLLGMVYAAGKADERAARYLGESLSLASKEYFIQMYLDEGDELIELLPKVRKSAPDLVDQILAAAAYPTDQAPVFQETLPDPLSDQEINVLKLIVAGKTNKEIAEELFISVGTAKWHVHNILQKLGVQSRAQAIAWANENGFE